MKRIRDDIYASGSQFKRPLGSSRGELFGQSPVPGRGDTEEEGVGGRFVGGEITNQKLTTNDALSYLREVKEMFQDQREKYDRFLEVMKDFKAQRTDTGGVIARVKELFKGHNNLIYGFNTFLPKGYEITLIEEDEPLPKKTVEFEEAINFVNKIKKRFKHDEHVYKSFLEILNMYRKENKEIGEVYNEVSILFEGHLDLLEGFTRFLPASLPSHSAAQHSRSLAQRYNDRGSGPPLIRQMQVEKERRRDRVFASRVDYSVDRYDLTDDKSMVKMQREQRKRVDKEHRARRGRDFDDREAEQDNLHHFSEKRKSSRRAEGLEAYSGVASHSEKDNLKSMYNQAFVFCEKVKERLCSQDDYQTFLKFLNMFSNGIVQRKDLQTLVSDLLGKFPDLMDEFNQFFERCESIDGFQHLAGVMSKKSFSSEEQLSRPMKVEEKDRDHKPDLEAVKETEQYKDEYMGKSIQELDLSDCECCTPSYRLLPADYPIPTASQKSELGAEVLNDHWVSVTSGSEDYSFKHMRRNQYEESLFKCEDDRFELDMLLESVRSAARSAETLLNIITEKKISFSGSFRIEDHFTALNLRCIERLYGDHGLDVIDLLHKNPATALPVVFTRLKQKQDEWKKCREDFDKVWANVYAKNHYKSLDHRSFYFKQQDSKNLSAKSLVAEIKELKEKSQNEDDVLLCISAGYRQPINPNLEYEYFNRAIHEDLYKLVQFSCEELCSTKEQLSKVLRLWENFVEAVLGVPPRAKGTDLVEDVVIKPKSLDVNHSTSINGEAALSSVADTANLAFRKLKSTASGDENGSSVASKHGGIGLLSKDLTRTENPRHADTADRDGATCSAVRPQIEQETGNGAEERFGMPIPMDISEKAVTSSVSIPSVGENNHDVVGKDNLAGSHEIEAKPSNTLSDVQHEVDSIETVHSTQGGDVGNSIVLANGIKSDSSKGIGNSDEPEGPFRIEKEEGELSPNGDIEDNFGVYEDLGVKSTSKLENSAQAELEADAEVENEDDADDDDSDNASEGGEDASGTESGGDECSQDENREEEDGEHDGKAESEGEAEGMDSHLLEGDIELVPQSERVLLSVRPLSKHVAAFSPDERTKDSRVFYGNDDFYVLFRLHQILYQRILSAKRNCSGGELKSKNSKDPNSLDPYARFMKVLYGLLDGSAENAKFEDECRAIIGNQSYMLFTLDKLIYKLVKQLQAIVADEMDNKLLQLYEYEKSRKPGRVIDSVYYENARVLLHEENVYRLECSSSPSRLSIQLMDSIIEKPEAYAVSVDPTFASYMQAEFLSTSSVKKEEGHNIVLKRNLRPYTGLDDLAALCKAMEGVEVVNGLECKMSCSSYKISYVLDTEDFFHRKKKKKRTEQLLQHNRDRVERFHRFLSASR
ncbi:PREDICTED: paired amphipathic helix protein Sin3-like 1 isoform X2 [Camelina sativa]|uniref:Paired amphipathic helix protein Sin3-like 1 isoform X1 n=1 Tax=Camelina sativa TaxID=90675 RepID=A0ABM0VZC9_CAMSA|nr:PREDICTED: paired amphipathic helix protein Sin3-like 1 isoform X1 [Camelina sativa]XP_010463540.1 PREDICTED: paired amphipathic helix protein Sin3-like 1 isoform X1 [Camelina sativa]XP_010463541.1 PREDICTED: paired amphipathic helix protein Sin3-like 1 isoform X1 [Camelina sativa]XP_010463543.1 PREDICTED: paired amphipathic helix protein Sin3-like 1 isoform X1 [Camelina sativa]XP_019092790.1 PREDICTED: paired amphipathic helix protein Sin3-like 1 isoform X2 [Camelina sativa]